MLAITHCESADVVGKFGAKADYTLCAAQWSPALSYKDSWFGTASDYANTFKKEYGYVPPYQAAESTAAVLVYADALGRAGSFESKKVRDAISETDLQTFYGNVKFDKTVLYSPPWICRRTMGLAMFLPVLSNFTLP